MKETSSIVTGRLPSLPMLTLSTGPGGMPGLMMFEFRVTRIRTRGSSRMTCCAPTIVDTPAAYAASQLIAGFQQIPDERLQMPPSGG
jgi:hypothetical protein